MRVKSITQASLMVTLVVIAGCGADNWNKSPLHVAAVNNNAAEVQSLVRSGVPVDKRVRADRTALIYAVTQNSYEAAVALLDAGANASAQDDQGRTPLMMASERGMTKFVIAMLAKHPALEVHDRHLSTALLYAARGKQAQVVKLLVAAGAKIDVRNDDGKNAEMLSRFDPAVVAALQGK